MLAQYCEKLKLPAFVSVAGEYGSSMLAECERIKILRGRMDKEEMLSFMQKENIAAVYDATHPYALLVSQNIKQACQEAKAEYIRISRDRGENKAGDYIEVKDTQGAADYLLKTEGNILITTGSKEIIKYKSLDKERLFARVLPDEEALEACKNAGIHPSHIIAVQGPFSKEMNIAMIHMYKCKYLVSKQSGSRGGFQEKLDACEETGCIPVIVGLPIGDFGISEEEAKADIYKRYLGMRENTAVGLSSKNIKGSEESRNIVVEIAGIGPGAQQHMSLAAAEAIRTADGICGGKRMLEAARELRRFYNIEKSLDMLAEYRTEKIMSWIKDRVQIFKNTEDKRQRKLLILMSGDSGFFSGARKLYKELEAETCENENLHGIEIRMLPAISSISYMASRFNISWEDMKIISLHGREGDILRAVEENGKVFAITSGRGNVNEIIELLFKKGYGEIEVCIGENLSYPDEKLMRKKVRELLNESFAELVSMILLNPQAGRGEKRSKIYRIGIEEEEFIRDKVPMTKSEVRAVSISKLKLDEDAICYDIGAGTGSVAIEMALLAYRGKVYAIEKKQNAISLLEKNIEKFGIQNIEVIHKEATEAIEDLPVPGYVFIGGSGGKLEEILQLLFAKSGNIRVVINAVSVESIALISKILKRYEKASHRTEMVLVSVSGTKKIGDYTMLEAKNPVLIAGIYPAKESEAAGEVD